MADPRKLAVFDTSSIIAVRRMPVPEKRRVWPALSRRVEEGTLVFPIEVFRELERNALPADDEPFEWAKRNRAKACSRPIDFAVLREVLERVPQVCDPEKQGVEEADPYVLTVALVATRAGNEVTVITEERKDYLDKMSLTTACGVLRLIALPVGTYLRTFGLL